MSTVSVPPVGKTALLTATARSTEAARPDALFADPWAAPLIEAYRRVGAQPYDRPPHNTELWDFFDAYFVCRTPFYDTAVLDAVAAGARQVVILAAGLDARAARLDLPDGVPVFELDTAPVLAFKGTALAEAGLDVARRVPVAADLAGDWAAALRAAGHRPDVPTVWLAEGLLMYLDAAASTRLVRAVHGASAPGSRIALEYFNRLPVQADLQYDDPGDHATLDVLLGLFAEGPPAPPREWLPPLGITVHTATDVAAQVAAHGRDVPYLIDPARQDTFSILLAAGTLN